MSTTLKRIISSLVLLVIVTSLIYGGKEVSLIGFGVLGLLVIDEWLVNFAKLERFGARYQVAFFIYLLSFYYINFFDVTLGYYQIFINMGLACNSFFVFYLFSKKISLKKQLMNFRPFYFIVAFYILTPVISLSFVLQNPDWLKLIAIFFLIVAVTDSSAWFWGKYFGKIRLWPAVSPKKTVEGAIGGLITSVLVVFPIWRQLLSSVANGPTIATIILLSITAQVGDLMQSKMKREFGIKDSSSLIPGHGGVYDRLDGHLFAAPVFAFLVNLNLL